MLTLVVINDDRLSSQDWDDVEDFIHRKGGKITETYFGNAVAEMAQLKAAMSQSRSSEYDSLGQS